MNSAAGQNALAVFDDPTDSTKPSIIFLRLANIKEQGFLSAKVAPTVIIAKKKKITLETSVTTVVVMKIDRGVSGSVIHVQTCYPDSRVPCNTSRSVSDIASKTQIASG